MCLTSRPRSSTNVFKPCSHNSFAAQPPLIPLPITMASYVFSFTPDPPIFFRSPVPTVSFSFPIFHGDFFEINNVVLTVVLDAKISLVRSPPPLRLEIELPLRHRLPLAVIRHLHAVDLHDRP